MGTTVTRSGEAILRIRVDLVVQEPVTGEAQVEPESPGTENAKVIPMLQGSGQSQRGIE